MTRYRFFTATSLDGFLADAHESLDWLLSQPTDAEQSILPYDVFVQDVGAIVTGRATYDWVVGHLETVADAWVYDQPTFVFSHRELPEDFTGITRVSGPPAAHRARLEEVAGDKDVWIVGGGDLAFSFAEAGMLDEIFVSIAPVTLGSGKPLMGGRLDLELRELGRNGALLEARFAVTGARS
ncbi:dihydrofolate reductase family protein [Brachybacterium sp. NPDC056505]|uniref:dihydrofolate reductase family protein n=1 Tax=Brachybacterium sp. NPDC056505 TaxID=3345843 RepID=UPI00366F1A65